MGRHAVEFIERHRGRPFFLYLAFNAVHSPWQAKREAAPRFASLTPPLNFYAAMIASLDENVGRVLAKLESAGLERNTLVAFASDNGPALGSPRIVVWPDHWPKEILVGSAGPLSGRKAQFLEGGLRVPFLLRWPARLPAGSVYSRPVSTMDLYPTFCAAAGAAAPPGTVLDGVNLLPFLRGESGGDPHEILFWKEDEAGAVRQGDWKLLLGPGEPRPRLFHLSEDIGEQHDLAAREPERLERLYRAWTRWAATLPPRVGRRERGAPPGPPAPGGDAQRPSTYGSQR